MAKKFKKIFSMSVAVLMLVNLLGGSVFADGLSSESPAPAIDKTALVLDTNDQTDVTLTVGGAESDLGVDIIYILGSFLSYDQVETNIMISCLRDTIGEIVAGGTTVNFGIVPFSSDGKAVMDLTPVEDAEDLEALPKLIGDAIEQAGVVYDAINMEAAFVKAKEMFSESDLAKHPERQHLVLISSGHTYFFNSGENNEYVSTVPVNFQKGTLDSDAIFYMEKAWMRARLNQTNTYPIPKAFVDEYNANPDKYDSAWDCYWTYIDEWAKADIASGDAMVYEATTIEKGDLVTWFNSGVYHSDQSNFKYSGNGAVVANPSAEDLANTLKITPGANPLTDESAAHAISYERAMWEAYEYLNAEITGDGINFYPVYNALRTNGTATNGTWCDGRVNPDGNKWNYGVTWTNQYIGHCFMNMLAGGKAIVYSETDNKAFFDPIKKSILNTVSSGSYVEDYIGYDAEKGNFEFIQDAAVISLTKGGVEYTTAQIATKEGADSSYAFTAPGASEATFTLDYYYGNGTTTEKFVWTFYEDVSDASPAELTYKLQLIDKAEEAGTYVVDTNISATLYPVNSDEEAGTPLVFPIPNVEYVVVEEAIIPDAAVTLTIDMSGTMYRYKMDGKRYVDVAKAKAIDFVTQYAASATSEDDLRMLAIAAFDTDAKVVLNWVDVNTASGLEAAKKAITNMKVVDNGSASSNYVCTNFDGGVILTRNMMKQSAVADIEKKFAIILSDGAPTVTVNNDTDAVGTIKSSFWGNQLNAVGKKYQNARCGGGWTHPAEVERTLGYLATSDNNLADLTYNYKVGDSEKEGIFIVGVGGDMSVKLFNDAVNGTSNGARTTDVKKKTAAFNNVDALAGYTSAQIMKLTTGDWMSILAGKVGGTYESAANSSALQSQFDSIMEVIKDVTSHDD